MGLLGVRHYLKEKYETTYEVFSSSDPMHFGGDNLNTRLIYTFIISSVVETLNTRMVIKYMKSSKYSICLVR